jgi:hypothetical protein
MSNQNLPVRSDQDFIAEFETMNLDELKDKTFLVAVNSGDRNRTKVVSSTIRGPYDFYEMIEQVGCMWREHQHHAKVLLLEKDPKKQLRQLDENTTDYIECHYDKIAVEGLLEGVFDADKEFTCKANVIVADDSDDPRKKNEVKEDAAQ